VTLVSKPFGHTVTPKTKLVQSNSYISSVHLLSRTSKRSRVVECKVVPRIFRTQPLFSKKFFIQKLTGISGSSETIYRKHRNDVTHLLPFYSDMVVHFVGWSLGKYRGLCSKECSWKLLNGKYVKIL